MAVFGAGPEMAGIAFKKGVYKKSAFYGGLGVDPWQNLSYLPVLPEGSTTGMQPEGDFV